MTQPYTGGCLCGAVRYRITAEPLKATHCHCRLCRRASGAAFLTFVAFPADAFAFTQGQPGVYRATAKAERTFCRACGSPLSFRHRESWDQIDVTAGTLDDPAAVRPQDHIWDKSRVAWVETADGLPRYAEEREG